VDRHGGTYRGSKSGTIAVICARAVEQLECQSIIVKKGRERNKVGTSGPRSTNEVHMVAHLSCDCHMTQSIASIYMALGTQADRGSVHKPRCNNGLPWRSWEWSGLIGLACGIREVL